MSRRIDKPRNWQAARLDIVLAATLAGTMAIVGTPVTAQHDRDSDARSWCGDIEPVPAPPGTGSEKSGPARSGYRPGFARCKALGHAIDFAIQRDKVFHGTDGRWKRSSDDRKRYFEHTRPLFNKLVTQFRAIAFTGEHDVGAPRNRLIKWTRPLAVSVIGVGSPTYFTELERFTDILGRLTGIPIGYVNGREAANVRIYMMSERQMYYARPLDDCYAEINYDARRFEIVSADIHINAENQSMRRHCIREELTQMMGLTNDSALYSPSIFNDSSRLTRLEREDRIMLVALYQPGLRPGMSVTEAIPMIERIMDKIIFNCPPRIQDLYCWTMSNRRQPFIPPTAHP